MNQRLRPVGVEGIESVADVSMAEAFERVGQRMLVDRPSVALVLWQVPGKDELVFAPMPGSMSLARGMICDAYAQLFPANAGDLPR